MRPANQRLSSLDFFRGIAIAGVFVYHSFIAAFDPAELLWAGWIRDFSPTAANLPAILLYPISLGWCGVPLFFVISGFCIHLSANKRSDEGPRGYFTRRFFRIYPPYLLALLVFALVWPWTRTSLHSDFGREQIASHALLIHNFGSGWLLSINPSFWTVAVEAQLYVLYPLLLLFVRRWKWRQTIVYLAVGEVVVRLNLGIYFAFTGQHAPAWLSVNPLVFWFSWSLGALLAEAHLRKKPLPLGDSSPWIWVVAVVVTNIVRPLSELTFLCAAVLSANLVARGIVASGDDVDRPRNALSLAPLAQEPRWSRHLRYAGVCSYSVYLIHQPLIDAFASTLSVWLKGVPVSGWLVFLACMALWFAIVPLSALLYRWVEKTSIAFGEKFLRTSSPRTGASMSGPRG